MSENSSSLAAKLELAATFIRRNWQVLILHDVAAGQCSCMPRADGRVCPEKSQGKHPRMGGAWQHQGISDAERVAGWLKVYPEANLGILAGPASGVWFLDVDPLNGGDASLAALEAEHGPLPRTWRQRTGSGGTHYAFLLPAGFVPGQSTGRLPAGIDVRGLGGQIVAPGSRTLLGGYELTDDIDPVPAPEWLLDLIRPAAPDWDSVGVSSLSHGSLTENPQLSAADSVRLRAYAQAAVGRQLAVLAATPLGRGTAAVTAGYVLHELINSPWAGLDPALVRAAYDQAAAAAMTYGGRFDTAEADAAWWSAARHVGSRGRPVPPEREISGVLDLPPGIAESAQWPVSTVPTQRAPEWMPQISGGPMPAVSSLSHGSLTENPQVTPQQYAQAAAEARFEAAVQMEAERIRVRAEAKRRVDVRAEQEHDAAKARLRAAMVDARGLDLLPAPEPLIKGWLSMDTVARVSGPPGSYKSFVLLDMAAHVGAGKPWHGHKVKQGTVLYTAAEGASGMRQRRDAWEIANGQKMTGVVFLPLPVQTNGPEWEALVELVRDEIKPVFCILDTQARMTVGVNENDAGEMGVFVHAVETLRRETGACTLLVHHTTADGAKARGSGAVLGAVHSELFVKGIKGATRREAVLSAGKQKDMDEVAEFRLDMVSVEVGTDADGDPVTSLVPRQGLNLSGTDGTPESMLNAVMREVFHEARGGTKAEVWGVVRERGLMKRATFYRTWNKLVTMGNMAMITGTQSYRYVPVEERTSLVGEAPGGVKTL